MNSPYAAVAMALFLSPGARAGTETILYAFPGDSTEYSTPILDAAGNLYGATYSGGPRGKGYIYRLSPDTDGTWRETTLHDFAGGSADGASAVGSLTLGPDGALYGATLSGGAFNQGTVYRLTNSSDGAWRLNILYSFQGQCGAVTPANGVTIGPDNKIYGIFIRNCDFARYNHGEIYELTPQPGGSWSMRIVYTVYGGENPADWTWGRVVFDQAGNLYGSTSDGGKQHGGTVFELTPNAEGAWTRTRFWSASGQIVGGVTLDAEANVYGTTSQAGLGYGTVFKLARTADKAWREVVLHQFGSIEDDGIAPYGTLVFDSAGNLYGTTVAGGAGGAGSNGTVFELTPGDGEWRETILYNFGNGVTGARPYFGALAIDPGGNLYGACTTGNPGSLIFQVTP